MGSPEKSSDARVLGVFEDEALAASALDGLERMGIARGRMSVMSSTPFPEGTFGTDVKPSRLPIFSAVGAVGGLVAGFSLAAGTALLYPLPTGGRPIVSLPTVGVVTFELTMLGMILLTLLGVLFEMRLPRVKVPPYDPRVSDGYVALLVPCKGEQLARVEETLREAGAVDVKRLESE